MLYVQDPTPSAARRWLPRCCRVLLLAGIACQAQPATAQTLRIDIDNPVSLADPHIFNTPPNVVMTGRVFESLVPRNTQLRLWPNVLRHDGRPLVADNVAFTSGRVPKVHGSNGGFSGAVKPLARVEVVDDHMLRFHVA